MKELIKNISFSCLSPKESNLQNFFVDFMKNWHFHSLKNESNYYIPHVIIIFCPLCTFFLSANQISNIRFTVSVANLRYFMMDNRTSISTILWFKNGKTQIKIIEYWTIFIEFPNDKNSWQHWLVVFAAYLSVFIFQEGSPLNWLWH